MAIRAPYVAAATSLKSVTDVCSAPQCSYMMCVNTHFSCRFLRNGRNVGWPRSCRLHRYVPTERTMRGSLGASTAIAMVLLTATARGRTLRQDLDTTPLLSGLLVIGESPTQLHRPLQASYGSRTAPRSHR